MASGASAPYPQSWFSPLRSYLPSLARLLLSGPWERPLSSSSLFLLSLPRPLLLVIATGIGPMPETEDPSITELIGRGLLDNDWILID